MAESKYELGATNGLRVHVRSSVDGISYDTTDIATFENHFQPGDLGRKTFVLNAPVPFIKVIAENLDGTHSISGITMTIVLNGE